MRYLFKHVLMRDAVYGMQLRTRLHELHRRAVAAIEDLYAADLAPYYADLAYHATRAGETAQAIHYTVLAGEQALAISSYRTAQAFLEQGLDLLAEQPLPDLGRGQMALLNLLGDACLGLCDYPQAAWHYGESLALARQIADPAGIADALLGLATSALGCGEYAAARRHGEEALAWSEGTPHCRALVLDSLGDVARESGDYAAAWEYARQSLAVCRTLGDRARLADSLGRLGNVAYVQGDIAAAEDYYRQDQALWEEVGQPMGIARCLNNLGAIAHRRGDYRRALECYHRSLELELEAGDRRSMAISWINMALVAQQQGDGAAAQGYAEQSLGAFREIGSRWGIAVVLGDLVPIYLQRGEPQRARAVLHEGLAIARDIQAVPRLLSLLLGAARLAWQAGRPVRAATWAGTVSSHPATEQDYRDEAGRLRQELSSVLPPQKLATAWERGATLDLDTVVSEILAEGAECATSFAMS